MCYLLVVRYVCCFFYNSYLYSSLNLTQQCSRIITTDGALTAVVRGLCVFVVVYFSRKLCIVLSLFDTSIIIALSSLDLAWSC